MALYVGNGRVLTIYLGQQEVRNAFHGTELVFAQTKISKLTPENETVGKVYDSGGLLPVSGRCNLYLGNPTNTDGFIKIMGAHAVPPKGVAVSQDSYKRSVAVKGLSGVSGGNIFELPLPAGNLYTALIGTNVFLEPETMGFFLCPTTNGVVAGTLSVSNCHLVIELLPDKTFPPIDYEWRIDSDYDSFEASVIVPDGYHLLQYEVHAQYDMDGSAVANLTVVNSKIIETTNDTITGTMYVAIGIRITVWGEIMPGHNNTGQIASIKLTLT